MFHQHFLRVVPCFYRERVDGGRSTEEGTWVGSR